MKYVASNSSVSAEEECPGVLKLGRAEAVEEIVT